MSGTGTSTGDFDDDQKGLVPGAVPSATADYVFAEVAGATAMPTEVPDGIDHADAAESGRAADPAGAAEPADVTGAGAAGVTGVTEDGAETDPSARADADRA